jgi:hypothetical protein
MLQVVPETGLSENRSENKSGDFNAVWHCAAKSVSRIANPFPALSFVGKCSSLD